MLRSPICPGGPEVSALAAGVWRMHEWGQDIAHRRNWIDTCLDLGIDCFDHADIYGGMTCESLFGEVLRESSARRERMTLISKCGIRLPGTTAEPAVPPLPGKVYDTSTAHILRSVNNSLARLGTDRIDVLLIHRPDPLMDPDAVAEAFGRLHAQGKVRFFGVSNHAPSTLALLASRMSAPLVTNQIELSAWRHEAMRDGTLDQCIEQRMRPMAWSPLGRGRVNEPSPVRDSLLAASREYGASVEAMALAWLMRHPSRPIPILGSGRLERLRDQATSREMAMDAHHWFRIYEAGLGNELP